MENLASRTRPLRCSLDFPRDDRYEVASRSRSPKTMSSHLQTTVLRSVSRSFYLSIRFLPRQLREPIALAYLLARTTDTVADTSQVSVTVRMETLKLLSDTIQGTASRDLVADLTASFVSLQENTSERQLLEALPD